jgi:nucleoside-diphosphate-sugar epimerase
MSSACLVTGAKGFIGGAVLKEMARRGIEATGASRTAASSRCRAVGEIDGETDWRPVLERVGCVVHAAGRAHILRDASADPLSSFRRVNVAGTRRLAVQAAEAGVRRVVFISSIGVNGISTDGRGPFTADDVPTPAEAYGLSKWEAEKVLFEVAAETGLEVVIVRPPLVYGPAVKANFLRLIRLVGRGWPLPLGGVRNLRSLVALSNVVDLLICCVQRPEAVGRTFLVSDGEDLSTPELLRRLGTALGVNVRLFSVPDWLLLGSARLAGRGKEVERLVGSLQVDIALTMEVLGWQPVMSVDEGLRVTVESL